MKKKALLLIILAAIVAAYFLRPGSGPGLEGLRQHIAHLDGWRAMHPMLFIALFLLGYVIVVALSLPFALWMTLAAGALFGLASGVVIASFASSIGATLAFLASRWVLRDWVLSRFGNRLKPLSDGLARDGSAYLFTLRLIPVVPFFLVNLLMGLTTMSGLRFYVVSQLGMLPATLVYVNAGTQLAQLSSVK
ncbi:MAG: VTT domain-containing protein, partial [Paracoccaceae bacterium]